MNVPAVLVGDLALNDRGAFKIGPFGSSLKKFELVNSGIPVVGIENVLSNELVRGFRRFITQKKFEELSEYEIVPDDILVTTMGTIGRSAVAPSGLGRAIFDSHLFRMRVDKNRVLPNYLCFALNSDHVAAQLSQKARGAIMEGLNTTILRECSIPLPPISEQRRIATVLAKAYELINLRHYALQTCDEFLPAVFLEVFAAPHDKWPTTTIEELAQRKKNAIRTGPFGSQLLHSEFTDTGIAVLGIDNAVNNCFDWSERRYITNQKYQQLKRYTVFPGDVIITIMGTCGRCAVVPDSIPLAINTKHLCCITLDQEKALPTFIHASFLYHPGIRRQLGAAEKGAIMEGLNMTIIKELSLQLPPLSLQRRFADLVAEHERIRAGHVEALRLANHLFQSLLHRSFSTRP